MKEINLHVQSTQSPIGIFDSGIGGLSIAKCIAKRLPAENMLYVADSKFAPYGELDNDAIIERVNTIAHWFVDKGCKAIVVACNTATVNAIDQLRKQLTIPIIGVEPAIKPAAKHSKKKKVGILVTEATANNKRFLSLVDTHKGDAEVFVQACPGLVNMIENGQQQSQQCKTLLIKYLTPLLDNQIDQLVLGCTHYPFVAEQIKGIVGSNMHLLETALPVTEQLVRQLTQFTLLNTSAAKGSHEFYCSENSTVHDKFLADYWQTQLHFKPFKH